MKRIVWSPERHLCEAVLAAEAAKAMDDLDVEEEEREHEQFAT